MVNDEVRGMSFQTGPTDFFGAWNSRWPVSLPIPVGAG